MAQTSAPTTAATSTTALADSVLMNARSGAAPRRVQSVRSPVSTTGGVNPRWSSNGRELLYITPDGELMAVPVQPGPPVTIGKAARLSAARAPDGRWGEFEVMADGRLLAVVRTRVASQQPMTVIVDWPAALSR